MCSSISSEYEGFNDFTWIIFCYVCTYGIFVTYIIHLMFNGIHNNEFEAKFRLLFQGFCVNCLRRLQIFLKLQTKTLVFHGFKR